MQIDHDETHIMLKAVGVATSVLLAHCGESNNDIRRIPVKK